jgi:SsrA-binding protein
MNDMTNFKELHAKIYEIPEEKSKTVTAPFSRHPGEAGARCAGTPGAIRRWNGNCVRVNIFIAFPLRNPYHYSHHAAAEMTTETESEKVVVSNRKALHDFFIIERFEAGIALKGTEVKSLRLGNANLQDGYALVKNGEVWLMGMHISPFEKGNINNHDPRRDRKLLLHKQEIRRLVGKLTTKGLTLIPLKVYFKNNIAKMELGLAQGKKAYDKRETIKRREVERELRREYAQ